MQSNMDWLTQCSEKTMNKTFKCFNCSKTIEYTQLIKNLQETNDQVVINCQCGYKQLVPESKFFETSPPKEDSDIESIINGMTDNLIGELSIKNKVRP